MVTLIWVARFTQERRPPSLGDVPPASIAAQDYETHRTRTTVGVLN
jgi:hypothetical protein